MIVLFKVSEKQRLNVACHLLLDTDIVLLDQPTEVIALMLIFLVLSGCGYEDNDAVNHLNVFDVLMI